MLNQCNFTGWLTSDPKETNGVAEFSFAHSSTYNGQEKTTWINFTAFKKTAENAKFLKKGDFATVSSMFQLDEYNGTKYAKFIAFSIDCPEMWARKKGGVQAPPQANPEKRAGAPGSTPPDYFEEDDIPF